MASTPLYSKRQDRWSIAPACPPDLYTSSPEEIEDRSRPADSCTPCCLIAWLSDRELPQQRFSCRIRVQLIA
eukprot:XP_001707717.1 Hypothetical protein GL50803_32348 [Giardia lamblia ATCC 50803]